MPARASGPGSTPSSSGGTTRSGALLARHQVIAGRMAVTFTGVFFAGAAVMTSGAAAYAAAATGLVMLVCAVGVLVRARRAFDRLVARHETLERELGGRATDDAENTDQTEGCGRDQCAQPAVLEQCLDTGSAAGRFERIQPEARLNTCWFCTSSNSE